jgi:hypothetical protein
VPPNPQEHQSAVYHFDYKDEGCTGLTIDTRDLTTYCAALQDSDRTRFCDGDRRKREFWGVCAGDEWRPSFTCQFELQADGGALPPGTFPQAASFCVDPSSLDAAADAVLFTGNDGSQLGAHAEISLGQQESVGFPLHENQVFTLTAPNGAQTKFGDLSGWAEDTDMIDLGWSGTSAPFKVTVACHRAPPCGQR